VALVTPAPVSLQAAFARQAALTPDAVALRDEGSSLTYRELDQATNRIARRLIVLGVRPNASGFKAKRLSVGSVPGCTA
jgi:non-ribosomal peptide synthetase component F